MPRFRHALPQSPERLFMADGGIETTLIFEYGFDLPCFASFPLLDTDRGMAALQRYYSTYTLLAQRLGLGLVLESPTWRASPSWAIRLGYPLSKLPDVYRRAIGLMEEFRTQLDARSLPAVIAGNMGPRGDGYIPTELMSVQQARDYHAPQVDSFAGSEADFISVLTMNYLNEAIGIGLAARAAAIPVVLSFTVETDGRLPGGESLQQAIERTDEALEGYPAYYMVNCAHPSHVLAGVQPAGGWRRRIRGVRANASAKSHAELNDSTTLDDGDPPDFGALHVQLCRNFPGISVVGGCCGTDQRHVEYACRALTTR